MQQKIRQILGGIEILKNVKILAAVEQSSRTWGYATPKSDYDVLFVFKQPVDEYLGIRPNYQDTIHKTVDNISVTGWNLEKLCKLAKSSNAHVAELSAILQCYGDDIAYVNNEKFSYKLDDICNTFNPKTVAHSYASTLHNHLQDYIKTKNSKSLLAAFRSSVLASGYGARGMANYVKYYIHNGLEWIDTLNLLNFNKVLYNRVHMLEQDEKLNQHLFETLSIASVGLKEYLSKTENISNADTNKIQELFLSCMKD